MNDWKQAWRRPTCSEGRDSLGAAVLTSDESATFNHCIPGLLLFVAGLVGEIVGGSLGLTLSIWDSLKIKDQGTRVTMTS